jgi:hypothetical protein
MQWIWRHVQLDTLPSSRVVIAFNVLSSPPRRFWLVLKPGDVALCPEHPGFDEDLEVTTRPTALYQLIFGRVSLGQAIEAGSIRVDGPTRLVRSLPAWLWLRPIGAGRTDRVGLRRQPVRLLDAAHNIDRRARDRRT